MSTECKAFENGCIQPHICDPSGACIWGVEITAHMVDDEVVFEYSQDEREWIGSIGLHTYKFRDYTYQDVAEAMQEAMPHVKVGFKAIDIGAEAFLRYGNVMWMWKPEA